MTLHDNSYKVTMEITRIYGNRKDNGIEVVYKNIDVFKKYNKGIKEQK